MASVLAADLGGTKCRFALVDDQLGVHRPRIVRTAKDRDTLLGDLEREFGELVADTPPGVDAPAAIGIGAAGVMSLDGGTLLRAPNLPLGGFALAKHLQARFGLPTTVLNDGRASAWGEYLRGHAKGCDPLLVLFFGTGIGIGLIQSGRPYSGSNNAAGEVGHTPWRPGGRRCPCGRLGCFEAYCGGGPITLRAAVEIGAPPKGDRWTVGDVVTAAHGDPRASAILDDAREAAVAIVAGLCTLLDPASVVLGGGVLQGWPELRQAIEDFVFDWCHEAVTRDLHFVPSLGESDAVLWGAAKATGVI